MVDILRNKEQIENWCNPSPGIYIEENKDSFTITLLISTLTNLYSSFVQKNLEIQEVKLERYPILPISPH